MSSIHWVADENQPGLKIRPGWFPSKKTGIKRRRITCYKCKKKTKKHYFLMTWLWFFAYFHHHCPVSEKTSKGAVWWPQTNTILLLLFRRREQKTGLWPADQGSKIQLRDLSGARLKDRAGAAKIKGNVFQSFSSFFKGKIGNFISWGIQQGPGKLLLAF